MASEQSKFAGLRNKTDSGAERQPQSRGNSGLSKNRKRMGRPPGKRSNPAYTQVTVHLNKEGYYEAQSRLNREKAADGFEGDLADVIDSLLQFYSTYGNPWDLMDEEDE